MTEANKTKETMTSNAVIKLGPAYFGSNANENDLPKLQTVNFRFESGDESTHIVSQNSLNARGLMKIEPQLKVTAKLREQFDDELIKEQKKFLHKNPDAHGVYLETPGLHRLPDGSNVSVCGNKVLGKTKTPYLLSDNLKYSVPSFTTGALMQLCEILLMCASLVLPAIAYVAATLIRSAIRSLGNVWQTVLVLTGGQGLGKTELASRLVRWIKDDETDSCPCFYSAGSTPAAMRDAMCELRDLPLVVDDLCYSASPRLQQKYKDTGAQLVREGANESLIIKKVSATKTQKLQCQAGLILTAEFALENASDITRCLFLHLDKPLGLPRTFTTNAVGQGMQRYMEIFLKHQDQWLMELQALLQKSEENNMSNVHNRVRVTYTILSWAWHCLMCAAIEDGLEPKKANILGQRFREACEKSFCFQSDLLKRLDAQRKKGNLAAVIIAGYENGAFNLAPKPKKLSRCDGILWKDDLCLRREALEQYVLRVKSSCKGE